MPDPSDWWRDAVVYQIYVRSFADGDGDGVGDLPGITARLPYLRDLGVDAVWLTPFYPSPQHDHGYDVADYCDVDPLFGTLDDFDRLLATAHGLGLRVVVDLVPNHTSSEHSWFRSALRAEPGSPERERYHFRSGRGPDGAEPPNNWQSLFGGPAWTRVPDGEWYLHLFDPTQPDLNWADPEVVELFDEILGFWLDRGVDGFRVDVAHGLVKDPDLRDQLVDADGRPSSRRVRGERSMVELDVADTPMWDQPGVHEVFRRWHRILDKAGPDRMTVGEAWTQTAEASAAYVRGDELDQVFNFAWTVAEWSAGSFRDVVDGTIAAMQPVGAAPTWVLSNHDVVRHPTRYGGGARGLARGRAATLAMLALPGSSYLYQGEELGLEEVDVPPEHRQDPAWLRGGRQGRDGSRVPLPWSGAEPPFGFGPAGSTPWIPQPTDWSSLTVEAQSGVAGSTLEFYRSALAARRRFATPEGEAIRVAHGGGEVFSFERGSLRVVVNCGDVPVRLPRGRILIASGAVSEDLLPPDTAVWLR
ncbi:alpha-glucosidase [Nocardioides terrae]|uniref:Alpha-glucosidase n=1 Tax=Nocardioides terrae TaxID=574651 RepID=A0A1I1K7N2_9ACTN|nr:glycoside hydrolase family 13 protein [Nocardioides terrae]SFC56302.1 alpha-glucosidase [Nocardioides terrae]